MVAKAKGEGVAGLLKELGIPTADTLKENLTKYREYLESQKSETQKATDKAAAETQARTAAEARADAAEIKAQAMVAGIDPAKVDRAAKLISAYDGDTPEAKVAAFLKENPEFKGVVREKVPEGLGGRVKSQVTPEMQKGLDAARAAAGLPPAKA